MESLLLYPSEGELLSNYIDILWSEYRKLYNGYSLINSNAQNEILEELKEAKKRYVNFQFKKFQKTHKYKISFAKYQDYRKRNLGSEILNNWFKGCNRHHINTKQIICIPKDIHRSYWHNHKNPASMIQINRIAFEYLTNSMKQL